jgi:hypothetical protein
LDGGGAVWWGTGERSTTCGRAYIAAD